MNKSTLYELHSLYEDLSAKGYNPEMDALRELIMRKESEILEDTSATGGPSVAGVSSGGVGMADASTSGMGNVYQSQPSSLPGSLNGSNWSNWGGVEGSGDISVPYNPSGGKKMIQKIKSPMGKNHGSKTGKKSRLRGMDLKKLRSLSKTSNQPKSKRVMNFDDFARKDITTKITKVKE